MSGHTCYRVHMFFETLVLDGQLVPADLRNAFYRHYAVAFTLSVN